MVRRARRRAPLAIQAQAVPSRANPTARGRLLPVALLLFGLLSPADLPEGTALVTIIFHIIIASHST